MHYYLDEIQCKNMIQYFQWYWTNYIDTLLDRGNVDVRLDSPRILLYEIISEIEYNKFQNPKNIKYFQTQLRLWYETDSILKSIAGTQIRNALGSYFTEQNQRLLLETCRSILTRLDGSGYVELMMNRLTQYLEDNTEISKETKSTIQFYTKLIVAEFVSKGFDLQDIRTCVYDIPGVIQIAEGEVDEAPDKFFEISRDQYSSKQAYFEAVRNRIEHRSIKEMLQPMRERYNTQPQEAYVLVRLSFIRGISEVCIDGVTIYSLRVRHFIREDLREFFEKESSYEKLYAAIPTAYRGIHAAIRDAKHKMDGVLEFLSLYFNNETGIEYELGDYCIVDNEGAIIGTSSSRAERGMKNVDEFYKQAMGVNVEEIRVAQENISSVYKRLQSISDNSSKERLMNALHWCRKANAAVTDEEKLIHSWFALEGLANVRDDARDCLQPDKSKKFDAIVSITYRTLGPNIFKNKWLYPYHGMLYRLYEAHKRLVLPADLKKRSGLDLLQGQPYKTNDFIRCAKELSENVNDELLKDELLDVSEFFSSIENYDKEVQQIKDNILNIYRYRNLIVHNAVIPAYHLEYYAKMVYAICREIISVLLRRCVETDTTIEQVLLRNMIEYDCFYAELPEQLRKINSKN